MRSPPSPTRAARSRCRNGGRRSPIGAARAAGVEVDGGEDGPAIDRDWGEPELTPAERVFAWNSFEVLAFTTGTPERPVNAIPRQRARALPAPLRGRHRFDDIVPALRRHLDRHGFTQVEVRRGERGVFKASRLDPADPVGRPGRPPRSSGPTGRADHPAQPRRLAAQRQSSSTCSGCRRSGCRIPMPAARSTRPTSICWRRSRARGSA